MKKRLDGTIWYCPHDDSIVEIQDDKTYWVNDRSGVYLFYGLEPENYGWVYLGKL